MASQWHPIFLTSEPEPGVWLMKYSHDVEGFGRIELRRVRGGGARYKVMHRGVLIGWAVTLCTACERLYVAEAEWEREARKGAPNAWPQSPAVDGRAAEVGR